MKGPPPSDALTLAYFPPPFLSTLCTDPCLPRTHTTPWRQRRLYVGRARGSHSGATQLLLQWSTPEWAQHSSCCCTAIMLRQARRHECRTAAEHARPPTCTRARTHPCNTHWVRRTPCWHATLPRQQSTPAAPVSGRWWLHCCPRAGVLA